MLKFLDNIIHHLPLLVYTSIDLLSKVLLVVMERRSNLPSASDNYRFGRELTQTIRFLSKKIQTCTTTSPQVINCILPG